MSTDIYQEFNLVLLNFPLNYIAMIDHKCVCLENNIVKYQEGKIFKYYVKYPRFK